ncbi:hypothetical protein IFM89_017591 [Coptis chinensis]|uniref:Uncharacterized protein n=1 Tax=Coptis chinensis TaxID=261450 RepID=A0A835LUM7_9MAGN|nr:hypothetical protein IFM89_017591 [Coptis chinensis]
MVGCCFVFLALAYLCRSDYTAGGFRMFSLTDASGRRTTFVALRNSLYLLPLGGATSDGFFESGFLALSMTAMAFSFYRDRTAKGARRMFHVPWKPSVSSCIYVWAIGTDNEQAQTVTNLNRLLSSKTIRQETEHNKDDKQRKES